MRHNIGVNTGMVQALERGCRERDVPAQLAAANLATTQLGAYLRVASSQYTVPSVTRR